MATRLQDPRGRPVIPGSTLQAGRLEDLFHLPGLLFGLEGVQDGQHLFVDPAASPRDRQTSYRGPAPTFRQSSLVAQTHGGDPLAKPRAGQRHP